MIKLKGLQKNYINRYDKSSISILKNINLEVEKGEIVALMGRSGVGKSTLLNILSGLESASEGEYSFNDINVRNLGKKQLLEWRKKNIGFILQNYGLISTDTVFDNISLPLLYDRVNSDKIKEATTMLIEKLQLNRKENSYVYNLSGGECQRVAIARSLVNNPKLILADEPTGALDKESEKIVINLLKEYANRGTSIIIVTHDLRIARQCDRILELKNGVLTPISI